MRFYRIVLIPVFFACFMVSGFSQENMPISPEQYIGMEPDEVWNTFGPPTHLFSRRGDNAAEDDVVFYRSGLYLYWFQNRIWQVRADRNYSGFLAGIRIGDSLDSVLEKYPDLLSKTAESIIIEINRDIYPVRLRLALDSQGTVNDMYLFRGDY